MAAGVKRNRCEAGAGLKRHRERWREAACGLAEEEEASWSLVCFLYLRGGIAVSGCG